jgi:rubrerythrin
MKKSTNKPANKPANKAQPKDKAAGMTPPIDLVYQSLETEMGGVEIYTTALQCVQNEDLREEWEKYLEQTKTHVEIMRNLCEELGLDPDRETPGRQVVRHIGKSLVKAMQMALGAGDPKAAEIVAAECVTLAETKDHANWELISKLGEGSQGNHKKALMDAADKVEDEEDEHLYHTIGWARELWLDALELPAQLPPPEEEEDVKSEEEAVQAKKKSMKARE